MLENPTRTTPRRQRIRNGAGGAFAVALVSVIAAVLLVPIVWMVVVALTPEGFSGTPRPTILPPTFTIDNFVSVVLEKPLLRWIGNSTIVALLAGVASCAAGFAAGYTLSRFRVRGVGVAAAAILVCQLIPHVSIVLPLYSQFRSVGLLGSLLGIAVAHIAILLPIVTWLSKGFFDTLPRELEAAAAIDGASRLRTFVSIAMPLTLPGLGSAFIYSFIMSWSDLLFARTLSSNPNNWTAPVGLASFNSDYYTTVEPMMAAAIVFSIPVVVVFVVMQRSFVSGLTGGSVKG